MDKLAYEINNLKSLKSVSCREHLVKELSKEIE